MTTTLGNIVPQAGTEQQWLVSVTFHLPANPGGGLPGGPTTWVFDKFSGGDPQAPAVKYRAGGQIQETVYGTLPVFDNLTVSKAYDTQADAPMIAALHANVGLMAASITVQPLGSDMKPWPFTINNGASGNNGDNTGTNATPQARTYTGVFIGIKDGNVDSTSTAVRVWECEFSIGAAAN